MKISHIAQLYFQGSLDAAKKRVLPLKKAGFLKERSGRRPYEPAILALARPAFEALISGGRLADYPAIGWKSLEKRFDVKEQTLAHELRVIDVKAALTSAIEMQPELSITEFSVWPRLCEFMVERDRELRSVKPDGLLRIGESDEEFVFYLEVDRGQETHGILLDKALDYLAHLANDGLAQRLGGRARIDFRLLMIFRTPTQRGAPSVERRNNMLEKLLLRPEHFGSFVWMTTLEEVLADPLGPIWVTAKSYSAATRGTEFDPEERRHYRGTYIRRPQREKFVEEQIMKRTLLGA